MEKKATREAYGKALVEIGKDERVVVLDADLSGSTKSADFKKVYPDRFFNMGIAESNMVDVAAGMALSGLKPYASSFAVFITGRAFEPVRQSICYQNLHVVLCGSHSGISVGEDGGSHQAIVDIALMRSLPNMKVFVPADYNEAFNIVLATTDMEGPVYIRTSRAKSPIITNNRKFTAGSAEILKEGKSVSLIACGMMSYIALGAAALLEKENIDVEVINSPSIKPLDEETIYKTAKKTKRVFTLEEHSVIGGLGGAVSEFLSKAMPVFVHRMGIEDTFGESGTKDDLFCKFYFDEKAVAKRIKDAING